MEFKYEGSSLKSGIYKITNKINNRFYYGSCKRFKERWMSHKSSLLNNKHQNRYFQADFNKCFEENNKNDDFLLFEVIEICEDNKDLRLKIEEEKYLKPNFDSGNLCYNLCSRAISREGLKDKNPEETKRKLSIASKRNWQIPEERTKRIEGKDGKRREKIGLAAKNVWARMSEEEKQSLLNKSLYANRGWKKGSKHTEEVRKLMSNLCKERFKDPNKRKRLIELGQKMAKTYFMIDPQGKKVVIHNMTKFCRENNLNKQNMLAIANGKGKAKSCKGWTRNILL